MGTAQEHPRRKIRRALRLTLREVSRRSGINPGRLSIIERGVEPTPEESAAIYAALTEQPTSTDATAS